MTNPVTLSRKHKNPFICKVRTAIIILNWNGKKLLERFLPSVLEHSSHLADIYVADNASTDDSVDFLRQHYPQIKCLQNETNRGYAGGYNEALKKVTADLYILLNSDVQTTEGWLPALIDLFSDPTIGAAQPKIKDLNNPTYFEYAGAAGGYLDTMAYPYCRGRIFDSCEQDSGQYDDTVEVHWASGACLCIRSLAFWEAGGFDESFFAHQEEIDLCWRLRSNAWRVVACGKSAVLHLGGGTLATAHPKKTFYNFRNTLFVIVKNVSGYRAFLIILVRLVLDGTAGLKFLFEGKPKHLLAIIKAHMSFYLHLPLLLSKRFSGKQTELTCRLNSIVYSYFIKGIKKFSKIKLKGC